MADVMRGPYTLHDAIQLALPKTLATREGHSFSFNPWYIQDELPKESPPAFPYGVFSIVNLVSRGRSRSLHSDKVIVSTPQDTDTFNFTTGNLDYELENHDVASIVSVVGTLSGTPGHAFVQTTDFTVVDTDDDDVNDTVRWTSGGDKPDNGTSFVVTYTHRMYSRTWSMPQEGTLRLIVKAKQYTATSPSRVYPKTVLAQTLVDDLVLKMRMLSGQTLSIPAVSPTLMERAVFLGPYISSGPTYTDPAESMCAWRADFRIRLQEAYSETAVQAIRKAEFDFEAEV